MIVPNSPILLKQAADLQDISWPVSYILDVSYFMQNTYSNLVAN